MHQTSQTYVCMDVKSLQEANYNKSYVIAEVLNQGTQNLLGELEDPKFNELAAKFPNINLHNRANSIYSYQIFRCFKR